MKAVGLICRGGEFLSGITTRPLRPHENQRGEERPKQALNYALLAQIEEAAKTLTVGSQIT
jgi:hypothetical protein